MRRRIFSSLLLLALLCLVLNAYSSQFAAADERPNVLWIISDDLGPELGCYGYSGVATPNIDRLAKGGIVFSKAFSTSPVCSSSRSALQTGRYQTSIGCYHHLTRDKKGLPDTIPTAIDLMREAGYFISQGSGVAKDKGNAKFGVNYLYDKKAIFDGSDWSQRMPGQPFFAQVHIKEPHRGFVKSKQLRSDAAIPKCYPDHPITRADWSNYLATVEVLDRKVGDILARLEAENLLDNTLVIFFGDHGRAHVRCKQWLYDGGIHTPLIVSWPAIKQQGTSREELASLLDVMPTTLAAAGVRAPKLPGKDLLAADWNGHAMLFAARDRCGDAPDRIRSVRTQKYKYIRNLHPELPYMQLSSYKKLSYPVHALMNVLHARGEWDSPFMAATRPLEELYALDSDPFELNNLASSPDHSAALKRLRGALDSWMESTQDQGGEDESKVVDMEALMQQKRTWYEKTMRSRGLDPGISDEDYLKWWQRKLGVANP
ncbi:MAG: sulfatase [Planctomycetota bacterium]